EVRTLESRPPPRQPSGHTPGHLPPQMAWSSTARVLFPHAAPPAVTARQTRAAQQAAPQLAAPRRTGAAQQAAAQQEAAKRTRYSGRRSAAAAPHPNVPRRRPPGEPRYSHRLVRHGGSKNLDSGRTRAPLATGEPPTPEGREHLSLRENPRLRKDDEPSLRTVESASRY